MRQPDITRARTLLGWEPKVPLEEGLPRTIEYFRKKLGSLARRRRFVPRPRGGFSLAW